MTDYVLAHAGDDRERERLTLLERFHGPPTVAQLELLVRPGWSCLEAGAGGGGMTVWLAERVVPGGSVLAVDLETHWLERLRSPVIDVGALDITTDKLPSHAFDRDDAWQRADGTPSPLLRCQCGHVVCGNRTLA